MPLIWSTETIEPAVKKLLEDSGGNVEEAIRRVTMPPCTWESARQLSVALSPYLGISEAEFMKVYKQLTASGRRYR